MKRTFLSFIMILLLLASSGATLFASAAERSRAYAAESASAPAQSDTASDDMTAVAATEPTLELFMPESYEQYLELKNPSDFAISENYIAIADGNTIYLYDRAAGTQYKTFLHTNAVTSLNFYTPQSGKTYLYFASDLGATNPIQYIDCTAEDFSVQQVTDTGINSCSSFVINGEKVCFANAQNAVFLTEIQDDLSIMPPDSQDSLFSSTAQVSFALYEGSMYFAAGNAVYRITGNSHSTWITADSARPITSFAVLNGTCYFSTSANGNSLWLKAGNNVETAISDGGTPISGVTAVHCYENTLYLIQNASIRSFSDNGFGNYEITKYSDRINRLGENARDISAYGNSVFIADTRNGRVVKFENGIYSLVCEPTSPEIVCAGENSLAVFGNSSVLSVYNYDAESKTYVQAFTQTVAGILDIAYSYGAFYAISSDGNAYKLTAEGNIFSLSQGTLSVNDPKSIATDIADNLYILSGDSNVYRMNSDQFLNGTSELNSVAVFGNVNVKQIACDYTGKIYGITNNAVYLGGAAQSQLLTDLSFSAIAYGTESASALSFSFGFESGDLYILSDGFIAKAGLGIYAPASLNSIPADGLYDSLHGSPAATDAENMLVTVPAGSVILPVADTNSVTESTKLFPYGGFFRTDEQRIGVRICAIEADSGIIGTVIAFYEYTPSESAGSAPGREYTLALVLENKDLPLTAAKGYTPADSGSIGYTTNEVGLYRFPLMKTGNAVLFSNDLAQRLPKSARVAILGTLVCTAAETGGFGLDFEYYFVAASAEGETVYGFIPTKYLLDYDSSADWGDSTEFTFRHVRRGETITLSRKDGDAVLTLDLSDEEMVKVYGEPDKNNMVYVTYTDENDILWSGTVNADLLYEATPSTLTILAVVALVTAAVLVSTCYLILRKQPTMQ